MPLKKCIQLKIDIKFTGKDREIGEYLRILCGFWSSVSSRVNP